MYDIIIIGGSHAGLSTALVLARAGRKVMVVDSGSPRNSKAAPVHAFHTRDGEHNTNDLLSIACNQLKKYSNVKIIKEVVNSVTKREGEFTVVFETNQIQAKKIVLATGVRDLLPQIPGLQELWGELAFRCPYCDAWELRGAPLAVIGREENTLEHLDFLRIWSKQLTLYTNGNVHDSFFHEKIGKTIDNVITSPIREVRKVGNRLVEIVSGDQCLCYQGIFLWPQMEFQTSLASQLGCVIQDSGAIEVDSSYETTVSGVYAVGDLVEPEMHMVALAVSSGLRAAFAINKALMN